MCFTSRHWRLEERGVDLFVLETFSYIEELLLAIDAIRSFSALPIVAQLTFSEEGTIYGDLAPLTCCRAAARKKCPGHRRELHAGPASRFCRFCGNSSTPTRCAMSAACPTPVSRSAKGDRIVYPKSSPEYFALFAREAAAMGVRILGGCCGTTPAHIRAMAEAVKSLRPAQAHRDAAVSPARKARAGRSRTRAGKQALEKTAGERICRLRRDRSAQRDSRSIASSSKSTR